MNGFFTEYYSRVTRQLTDTTARTSLVLGSCLGYALYISHEVIQHVVQSLHYVIWRKYLSHPFDSHFSTKPRTIVDRRPAPNSGRRQFSVVSSVRKSPPYQYSCEGYEKVLGKLFNSHSVVPSGNPACTMKPRIKSAKFFTIVQLKSC